MVRQFSGEFEFICSGQFSGESARVVIVMVRLFSGELEYQFQWWSDNSTMNCRTQAQDNSAVNLPKRGDCDGLTIQRWIWIHMLRTIQRWICPSVVIVMVRQFSGEFEFNKLWANTRKCQRRILVIWRIAERAWDWHGIVVSAVNQRWIMLVKCIFLESTLKNCNILVSKTN